MKKRIKEKKEASTFLAKTYRDIDIALESEWLVLA
jgi:hypothetical protein